MEEIAKRFQKEYTELLSRYKEHLSNAQIMSILQSITKQQIGFKDNPERFKVSKEHLEQQLALERKAKEIIKDQLHVLPKENVEGIYEVTEEAEQFFKGEFRCVD